MANSLTYHEAKEKYNFDSDYRSENIINFVPFLEDLVQNVEE